MHIIYARRDAEFMREFKAHLSTIRQHVSFWHKGMSDPGDEENSEWADSLGRADLVAILVSAYLHHDCDDELDRALGPEVHGRIIPILVRHTETKYARYAARPILPRNGKPISAWRSRDQAWVSVINEILKIVPDPPASGYQLAGSAMQTYTLLNREQKVYQGQTSDLARALIAHIREGLTFTHMHVDGSGFSRP